MAGALAGPLRASLPAITIVNPIASLVIALRVGRGGGDRFDARSRHLRRGLPEGPGDYIQGDV